MNTVYHYNIPDTMSSEDCNEFKSNFDDDEGSWLAEQAAENYHNKHDGWESSWPVTFIIRREDESVIGTYEVDREAVPQFSATEVKK